MRCDGRLYTAPCLGLKFATTNLFWSGSDDYLCIIAFGEQQTDNYQGIFTNEMINLTITRASFILLVSVAFLANGCSGDKDLTNRKPQLEISPLIDGLKVTLQGTAFDNDGKINSLTVSWGDKTTNRYLNNDFTVIDLNHTYLLPADYTIQITAKDDSGDSTILTIPVVVDFKETSLSGIKASMFKVASNEFLILTTNLHTYQETQQNEKFNRIADVIGKMDIDFIAFQECAQNKSAATTSGIVRTDNMALVVSERVKAKYNVGYNFVWDWSHYGFSVYEEGVAILSKHNRLDSGSRYISTGTGTGDITSRKAIYGSYQVPAGRINIFSVHTHWRLSLNDEEQNNQVKKTKLMVSEMETFSPDAGSLVCGDFNGNATSDYPWSEGYNTMMRNGDYTDSFRDVYPDANTKPAQGIYNTVGGDFPGRIDYIFLKNNPHFRVADSQIIFSKDVVGEVSDHYGVLTKVVFTR
jgi:maltose 6'-phosphate phosphatase